MLSTTSCGSYASVPKAPPHFPPVEKEKSNSKDGSKGVDLKGILSKSVDLKGIDYLCFSGGGNKGYAYEGALLVLETKNPGFLKRQKGFIGTSIGAFLSLFLSLGATLDQIREFLDINELNLMDHLELSNFFSTDTITPTRFLLEFVEKVISKTLGKQHTEITFQQLYAITEKELCICVVNQTLQQIEYHSRKTTPNYKVTTSVQASMSIPFVFSPVTIGSSTYIDGGFLCNTPLSYFPIDKTLVFVPYSPNTPLEKAIVTPFHLDLLAPVLGRSTSSDSSLPTVATSATSKTFEFTTDENAGTDDDENNAPLPSSASTFSSSAFSFMNMIPSFLKLVDTMMHEILIQTLKQLSPRQLRERIVFFNTQDISVLSLYKDKTCRPRLNEIGKKSMTAFLA